MRTLIHLKNQGNSHFHPQHALFTLLASFVLALLVMLILVSSAS
ncbi:MAG TPA: hypothetical protein VK466_04115 [Terriglobales bacterium]|nr:hypothetical protein [Terriglobales bacterium]